jgi:hypothetical protein
MWVSKLLLFIFPVFFAVLENRLLNNIKACTQGCKFSFCLEPRCGLVHPGCWCEKDRGIWSSLSFAHTSCYCLGDLQSWGQHSLHPGRDCDLEGRTVVCGGGVGVIGHQRDLGPPIPSSLLPWSSCQPVFLLVKQWFKNNPKLPYAVE